MIQVSEVARETNTSKGLVSKYLNRLVEEKVLEKDNDKFLVRNTPEVKAVKIFLNLISIDTEVFRKFSYIKSAGVYGSLVKGTNTGDSDIDVWILHEHVKPEVLSQLSKKLGEQGNIKPLYLTYEKVDALRINDPVFYYSLIFGSVTLYGEDLGSI
jgi:predicted nucleotidyltransferase